jgi:hypothetical protein
VVENVRSCYRLTFSSRCWIQAEICAMLSSGSELWRPRNFRASSSFFRARQTLLNAQSKAFPNCPIESSAPIWLSANWFTKERCWHWNCQSWKFCSRCKIRTIRQLKANFSTLGPRIW